MSALSIAMSQPHLYGDKRSYQVLRLELNASLGDERSISASVCALVEGYLTFTVEMDTKDSY